MCGYPILFTGTRRRSRGLRHVLLAQGCPQTLAGKGRSQELSLQSGFVDSALRHQVLYTRVDLGHPPGPRTSCPKGSPQTAPWGQGVHRGSHPASGSPVRQQQDGNDQNTCPENSQIHVAREHSLFELLRRRTAALRSRGTPKSADDHRTFRPSIRGPLRSEQSRLRSEQSKRTELAIWNTPPRTRNFPSWGDGGADPVQCYVGHG